MVHNPSIYDVHHLLFLLFGLTLPRLFIWAVNRGRKRLRDVAHCKLFVFVFLVCCGMIVTLENFHHEGHQTFDKDGPARFKLAPLFEKINELCTQGSFAVFSNKDTKKLRCYLRSHLCNSILIEHGESLEGLNWQINHFFISAFKQLK